MAADGFGAGEIRGIRGDAVAGQGASARVQNEKGEMCSRTLARNKYSTPNSRGGGLGLNPHPHKPRVGHPA